MPVKWFCRTALLVMLGYTDRWYHVSVVVDYPPNYYFICMNPSHGLLEPLERN